MPTSDKLLGLELADWIVLVGYFVLILAIGLWSHKRVKNTADFFMGGRRFGRVFMMFFAFGAGTSSDQAISVVAGTWRVGLAGIWWQFLWLWATPFYWIVAPIMRRMRALTTADFFEARFNTATATMYTVYGIIISIVFIAGGLYGSGKMINALTGGELDRIAVEVNISVPDVTRDKNGMSVGTRRLAGYEYAILAMTVLFVTYGMAGGLGAAIITDFIQGVLTIIFSFLLLPFVFSMIGGFGALHGQSGIKQGMLDFVASPDVAASLGKEPITAFYVFMLSFTALAGIVVQPHIMGVCGAGRTEFDGRFGITVGNFLKRFCTIAWTFTGLACIVWYLGDNSPLQHIGRPLTEESGVTFEQLGDDKRADDLARFRELPEQTQEQIRRDRSTWRSITTRNDTGRYNALPELERKAVHAADRNFSDGLFGRAAYDILPTIAPGLIGLLLASLLAAVMSSSDAQMVVSSGLFTENIYRRFLVRDATQQHYLWVGRLAGLAIVGLALILQGTFRDVVDALRVIIKTPAVIGISLWFGITWRRWNSWAVWVSTAVGILAWLLVARGHNTIYAWGVFPDGLFTRDAAGSVTRIRDVWQMFIFMAAGIASGIVVSLLTPMQSKEKLDPFYRLMRTPVTTSEHVEMPCTLPEDPAPEEPKMFAAESIEIPRATRTDIVGFVLAWTGVGLIIWLTRYLSVSL